MPLQTDILKSISTLHYLTQDGVEGYPHADLAKIACDAGIKWLQLRVKNKSENEWLKIAEEVKGVTDSYNCTLIINDNVSIAKSIDANGVHLGKKDMSIQEARIILGPDKIIGGTANNEEDILKLKDSTVNYIGLGPFRFTTTKENLSPVLGLEKINALLQLQNKIPVILIGGITLNDIPLIMKTTAHGVAISSAINLAEDKTGMVKEFIKLLSQAQGRTIPPLNSGGIGQANGD